MKPEILDSAELALIYRDHKNAYRERDALAAALLKIRTIKQRVPFDAADAASECIEIAKEALGVDMTKNEAIQETLRLRESNAKLRAALEKYADSENWTNVEHKTGDDEYYLVFSGVNSDGWELAQAALAKEPV